MQHMEHLAISCHILPQQPWQPSQPWSMNLQMIAAINNTQGPKGFPQQPWCMIYE